MIGLLLQQFVAVGLAASVLFEVAALSEGSQSSISRRSGNPQFTGHVIFGQRNVGCEEFENFFLAFFDSGDCFNN